MRSPLSLFAGLAFWLIQTPVIAQMEYANWYFGLNAGVSFISGSPVNLSGSALSTQEGTLRWAMQPATCCFTQTAFSFTMQTTFKCQTAAVFLVIHLPRNLLLLLKILWEQTSIIFLPRAYTEIQPEQDTLSNCEFPVQMKKSSPRFAIAVTPTVMVTVSL